MLCYLLLRYDQKARSKMSWDVRIWPGILVLACAFVSVCVCSHTSLSYAHKSRLTPTIINLNMLLQYYSHISGLASCFELLLFLQFNYRNIHSYIKGTIYPKYLPRFFWELYRPWDFLRKNALPPNLLPLIVRKGFIGQSRHNSLCEEEEGPKIVLHHILHYLNHVLTWPTIQLEQWQFNQRQGLVMLVAATVVLLCLEHRLSVIHFKSQAKIAKMTSSGSLCNFGSRAHFTSAPYRLKSTPANWTPPKNKI